MNRAFTNRPPALVDPNSVRDSSRMRGVSVSADGYHYAASPLVVRNFLVGRPRNPLDIRKNQHWMLHSDSRDRLFVDEVEIISGIQNPRNEACAQKLRDRLTERCVS